MKLVSIIVASYNRTTELKRALESLAIQTYSKIEIVLVDDNGQKEKNSAVSQIVNEFTNSFPQISLKYIANPQNCGSAKTRNIGIEAATGEYITFLDDDDVYLPEKIENQVEFMEKQKLDYSITDLVLYNESGKEINKRTREYIKDTSASSLRKYHLKYHMTGTDTLMFRKEYLLKIGGFSPINVGDEFYLMQKAIDGEGKFGYIPQCYVKAFVHTGEGGLSSGDGKIKGENALYEYKKKFFSQLSSSDIRYINARHFAVIAYAELRRKNLFSFMLNSLKAFFSSPKDFFKIIK